ncbi:hypothetical protein BVIET440_120047 [Burkholderia vietnamiensis]
MSKMLLSEQGNVLCDGPRTLERRMDLSKQAANAVAGLRDLSGEVVIEATEHGELGELFVGQSKRALRMRHLASGFGDDRGIAGVGLGFAGVRISDAAHGQSGQIGDKYAFSAGDGYRKRADGGRLIDNEQQSAVSLEFGDEGAVYAESTDSPATTVASLGIYVPDGVGISRPNPYQRSPATSRPGDNTSQIMTATGGGNHAGPGWPTPQLSGREDSNGRRAD